MSKLLIVESPTKARTISRMLGAEFKVIASMGHVRDLPEHSFGINIENDFAPDYTDTPRSRPIIKELRAAASKADEVYLATDPDREGEAIAWHIKNALQETMKKQKPFHRITFHEITRQAVENAIANKSDIDLNLVDAQQARRVLDRIVGYQVSPLLWRKLEKGSSAGRVQSAALRIVVEREREIAAFTPEEYWNFVILFAAENAVEFRGKLFKIDGADFKVRNASDAAAVENAVKSGSTPIISAVTRQERKRNPYPPFTTSTLQQAANQLLHYTANSTMRYAQQLYEGVDIGNGNQTGLITYMRTDSVTIAKEAQIAAKEFITETYGAQYAPEKFNYYKNKAASQEAHEAIRPTDVRRTPESLANVLDASQLKLYTLIWRRFVASQMVAAKQELVTADVAIDGADGRKYTFHTSASCTIFPGFLLLTAKEKAENEDISPELLKSLRPDSNAEIKEFEKEQKFTEPPPRFTEAALIRQLEENGIGRPSTYAAILRTIQDRDYVKREQSKLIPTELGFTVNDFLVEKLPELFDIGFTAQMEQQLDDIEAGEIRWTNAMSEFYSRFAPWVAAAKLSGAPETGKAKALLGLFDNVTYRPAQKIGSRTYDDKKFVNSVKTKFEANPVVSEKQYQALLAIAANYVDQIDFAALPEEVSHDISEAAEAVKKRNEELKQRPPAPEGSGYKKVFDAFANVKFAEPRPGTRGFDEKKFFNSLKKQALGGANLSEKQLAALKRMISKYRNDLIDASEVFAALGMDFASEGDGADNGASQSAEAVKKIDAGALIAELAKVQQWAEPTKRGRFTFDDKKFFQSLQKQYADGKQLSDKQLNALEKLAEKYKQN